MSFKCWKKFLNDPQLLLSPLSGKKELSRNAKAWDKRTYLEYTLIAFVICTLVGPDSVH
jgi:hypothetical protein